MANPRLFIFDLDNTALGGHEPYAQFPPHFCQLLDNLADRDIQWATCTTWSVTEQAKLIVNSAVMSRPACLCGASGRQLARLVDGEAQSVSEHDEAIQKLDGAFRERNWPEVRQLFIDLLEDDLVNRLAFDYYRDQCAIDFSCCEGCADRVWELLAPLLESGEYYSMSGHGESGTLLPAHMNKGLGVKAIHRLAGVAPADTIIAGDGLNDLPMFDASLAGWLICPSNAAAPIKEKVQASGGKIGRKPYSWGIAECLEEILSGVSP